MTPAPAQRSHPHPATRPHPTHLHVHDDPGAARDAVPRQLVVLPGGGKAWGGGAGRGEARRRRTAAAEARRLTAHNRQHRRGQAGLACLRAAHPGARTVLRLRVTTGTTLYLRSASLSTLKHQSMPSTASRPGTTSLAPAAGPYTA